MIKRLVSYVLCIILCFFCVNIYAEDENGLVNPKGINESFDKISGMYIEKIDEGIEFIASIPNGAVVSDAVYFEVPSNINASLECDGKKVDFVNKSLIYNPGYYIMKLSATNSVGEDKIGAFVFRISSAMQNKVNTKEYKYPKISCSANITVDTETGLYKYMLPNYKGFFTNIESYGQEVESAKFIIPRNLGYSLKRNGGEIKFINNQVYKESGNYSLKVFGFSYAMGNGYEACYETVLNFTIPSDEPLNNEAVNTEEELPLINNAPSTSYNFSLPKINNVIEEPEREIINDSLLEAYFESAGIYSETFSSGDAFYTNTPNDGIVGGNVYLDVPYNMSVSMTKDGTPVEFKNKTYINEEGSYSLLITDVYNSETSTARYSFRIQKGIDRSADVAGGKAEDTENITEAELSEEISNESEDIIEYSVENKYNEEIGMYVYNVGDEEFYTSVPDGMFSNYNVLIQVPENLECIISKNDEDIEYTEELSEDGRYRVKVSDDKGNETEIGFDIGSYTVNYMSEFVAPEGYSFIVAEYSDYNGVYNEGDKADEFEEGLNVIDEQTSNLSNVFSMPIDGQYDFILQGSRGMPVLSATILLDTMAPQVIFEGLEKNMKTSSESITVYCDDSEADLILISKDSEESLDLSNGSTVIKGKGKYKLRATDLAGNVNEYDFVLGSSGSISKSIAVFMIVLLLGIMVTVIVLLRKGVIRADFFVRGEKKPKKEKEKKPKIKKEKKPKTKKEKKPKVDKKKNNKSDDDFWEDTDIGLNEAAVSNDDWENTDISNYGIEESDDYDDWENS